MIHHYLRKIKQFGKLLNQREDIFLILIILLVGFGGFGLGRLSALGENKNPVRILNNGSLSEVDTRINTDGKRMDTDTDIGVIGGKYVASKNGGKYHFPWCSGAQRIKEENKIWFETKGDAERAGYGPAANCKGL